MIEQRPTIGIITPPRYRDPAPAEFPTVVDVPVHTQQFPLPFPEFDFRIARIADDDTQEAMVLGAQVLASCQCDLVVQAGTPFAWCGVRDEAGARARNQRLADAAGVPSIMTALAIIDALRTLRVDRAALACTYYPPEWRDAWSAFVRMCEIDVGHAANLADEGLVASTDRMEDFGWSMTPELVRDAVAAAARSDPGAGAIVLTGTGARTLDLLNELEAIADRPVIGADTVVYNAAVRALDLPVRSERFGRLGAT